MDNRKSKNMNFIDTLRLICEKQDVYINVIDYKKLKE